MREWTCVTSEKKSGDPTVLQLSVSTNNLSITNSWTNKIIFVFSINLSITVSRSKSTNI